jgi:hypothetical protein
MKGRCAISFIGRVRNGMPLISRGFHGGRRTDVDATRVPPGQYVDKDSRYCRPVPRRACRSTGGCLPWTGPLASRAPRPSRPQPWKIRWVLAVGEGKPALGRGCRRMDHRSRSSRSRTRPRCQLGAPAADHRNCRLRGRPGHGTDIEWGRTPALGPPQTQYQRPIDPRHRGGVLSPGGKSRCEA